MDEDYSIKFKVLNNYTTICFPKRFDVSSGFNNFL